MWYFLYVCVCVATITDVVASYEPGCFGINLFKSVDVAFYVWVPHRNDVVLQCWTGCFMLCVLYHVSSYVDSFLRILVFF